MDAQNIQNTVTISSQEYKELILESAELKARVKDAESKESDERSKRWSVESDLTTLKEKTGLEADVFGFGRMPAKGVCKADDLAMRGVPRNRDLPRDGTL